jgi:hypothetical protein
VDIVVSENRKLVLMNSFSYQASEDILYYTLFVCEQLGINTDTCRLTVTGNIIEGSSLYLMLYKFIRHVQLPGRPAGMPVAIGQDETPFHELALMYNLSLCE